MRLVFIFIGAPKQKKSFLTYVGGPGVVPIDSSRKIVLDMGSKLDFDEISIFSILYFFKKLGSYS